MWGMGERVGLRCRLADYWVGRRVNRMCWRSAVFAEGHPLHCSSSHAEADQR
jgi:hypothetical protein